MFFCFPLSFYVCFVFMSVFRLQMQKFKKTRRKHLKKNRKKQTKHIKTLRKTKQHRNTGYPALDSTANKYLSGSGWEIYVFFFSFLNVFLFSFELFCFPSSFVVFLRVVLVLFVFICCFSIVNAKA